MEILKEYITEKYARSANGGWLDLPPSNLGALRDLTEHLEEWSPDLEAFFETFPELLCIANRKKLIKVNPKAWYDALGYEEAELLATPWAVLVHPDDLVRTEAVAERMKEKPVRQFRSRYRHKNGTWVTLSWSASKWTNERTLFIAHVIAEDCLDCKNWSEG